MNKHYATLLALLLLLACQQNTTQQPNYRKGTEGLSVETVEQAPPDQVYAGTTFPVTITARNNGATNIPMKINGRTLPAHVSINYNNFYLTQNNPGEQLRQLALRGKSDITPRGEAKTVKVTDFTPRRLTGERESPQTQLYVSVCYPYRTTLSTDVCMDSSSGRRNLRKQVCQATDHTYTGGQGAPVSITKIEVNMYPSGNYLKPQFVIHVKNTGDGSVLSAINPDKGNIRNVCTKRDNVKTVNTIHVNATLSKVELQCKPNPVTLDADSNKVFCQVSKQQLQNHPNLFTIKDNFETTLNVNLRYFYTTGTSTTVEIQRRNVQGGPTQTRSRPGRCDKYETRVNGKCKPRCAQQNPGFSCSCMTDTCVELGTDRCKFNKGNLCSPGVFCCQRTPCEDIKGRQACTAAGCTYNGTTCKEGTG